MKIFLSWSGERSKAVALALREWLPLVLHYAEPWMSQRDIAAGERWAIEIGHELETTHFGVICLTKDNLAAAWLLFEAGALSKAITKSAVVPYLLDADFSDISGPLSQFQAKKAERAMTLELVEAMNLKAERPIDRSRLLTLFELAWPQLEQRLRVIPAWGSEKKPVMRSQHEILEEIVASVRALDRRLEALEVHSAWSSTAEKALGASSVLTVDTSLLMGKKGRVLTLPYSRFVNVSEFLDELWFVMNQHGGPPVNSYGRAWALRDRTGRLLRDMGRTWAGTHGKSLDERALSDVGIFPGQVFDALPITTPAADFSSGVQAEGGTT